MRNQAENQPRRQGSELSFPEGGNKQSYDTKRISIMDRPKEQKKCPVYEDLQRENRDGDWPIHARV